ncbi:uncharacterized protein LOC106662014 isoform X2 [Cimex lectularius]|uniref:Uncharacterized protein n=1 Tax=Cimex lectularius TaxID=79782 RepID=A0A8I6SDK3_CIMLE|nr:uncharacterized protein LOC106662014 isoform X2 [Cimex lectularius]
MNQSLQNNSAVISHLTLYRGQVCFLFNLLFVLITSRVSVGKMPCNKIYGILCFIALTKIALSNEETDVECEKNQDCPKGTYCYKESALYKCVPCSSCIRFFRKNSTFDDCPQRPEQCGECIAGYHSPKLTDGSETNTCTLIDSIEDEKSTLSSSNYKVFENLFFWLLLLVFPCILILLVVIFFTRKKCLKCATKGAMPVISEMERLFISPRLPPPFYQSASLDNIDDNEDEIQPNTSSLPFASEIEIVSTGALHTQVQCEFDRKVQASNYKIPLHMNEESVPEQAEQVEEENLPEIYDDNTQPSTWRPFAESDQDQQQGESESTAANSGGEEIRHFAMISAESSNSIPAPEIEQDQKIEEK